MLNPMVRGHDRFSWNQNRHVAPSRSRVGLLGRFAVPGVFLLLLGMTSGCAIVSPSGDGQDEDATDPSTAEGADGSGDLSTVAYSEPAKPTLSGAPNAQDSQSNSDDRTRRERLKSQYDRILTERAIDTAQGHFENNEYEKSEAVLMRALEENPTSTELLRELENVQERLGKRSGEIGAIRQRAIEKDQVKRAQLRFEATEHYERGLQLMERGNYDDAIVRFQTTLNHIRWATGVDWEDLESDTTAALDQANAGKTQSDQERQEAIENETFRRLKEEEDSETAKRDQQINTLLFAAISQFENEKYAQAEKLAGEILKIDPGNDKAYELQASSKQAAREKRESNYVRDRKERYLRWKESIEEARVPYHGILTEPDADFWAYISSIRSSELALTLPPLDPETENLRRSVASERMPANFDDADIDTVANAINVFTNIPVNVDPETRTELEDSAAAVTLSGIDNIPVESLLNLVTEQLGEEITWTIRNGTVMITNKTRALGEPLIRIHAIQDITFSLQNFQGPKLDELPLPDDSLDDFDEGPGLFGGDLEKEVIISPEEVQELVVSTIARGTWEEPYVCEVATNQQLLVIHTPEVQRQVASFLDDLRRFSSTVVTIDSRFVTITDAFVEDIGADLRGLGNEVGSDVVLDDSTIGLEDQTSQGLDNEGSGADTISGSPPAAGVFFNDNSDGDIRARTENFFSNPLGSLLNTIGGGAFQFSLLDDTQINLVLNLIRKSANATVINKPTLTVFNTNRAYITVINEVSYLQGFGVDVANSAFIANPNIGIIQEGVVLDVKPTISYDRKYITLDVQTTVADLLRPIPEFEASLGGFSTPVTFQLPELKVSSTATTVRVPDGGSLILGGMKKIRYVNRHAGIPWFSKIPILGFFFSEKGVSDEVENVIVMVRASITDMGPLRDTIATSR